jgi:threonine dehydratase
VALESFARYPLTFGPSPVHRLDRLTAHLGGAAVWAKREDVSSGRAFGGKGAVQLGDPGSASSAVSRDLDVGQTNGSTMMCAASWESRFQSGGQSEL